MNYVAKLIPAVAFLAVSACGQNGNSNPPATQNTAQINNGQQPGYNGQQQPGYPQQQQNGQYPQQNGYPQQQQPGYPQQQQQPGYPQQQQQPGYPQQQQPGYPQQQQQPGYPQQQQQTPGYPQQQQPGVTPQPGQPGVTPQPGMPGQQGQTPAPAGNTAQAVDPNVAGLATTALANIATTQAPGMAKDGNTIAGNFTTGQTLTAPFTIQPGKCYTVIAAGVGAGMDVDITAQASGPIAIPGFNPQFGSAKGKSTAAGSQAVLGAGAGCIKLALSPIPIQATYVITVSKGSGMAAAQLYSK